MRQVFGKIKKLTEKLFYICIFNQMAISRIGKQSQTEVSFSCICPISDHEFCPNNVNVALDPSGDSRVVRRLLRQCYDEIHDR